MSEPRVRKFWIGWWVHHPRGGWCPTRNVLDHCLRKIERAS